MRSRAPEQGRVPHSYDRTSNSLMDTTVNLYYVSRAQPTFDFMFSLLEGTMTACLRLCPRITSIRLPQNSSVLAALALPSGAAGVQMRLLFAQIRVGDPISRRFQLQIDPQISIFIAIFSSKNCCFFRGFSAENHDFRSIRLKKKFKNSSVQTRIPI